MAVATYRLKNGIMSDMHIAVGGAEATPRRIPEAERTLIGRAPNLGTFQAAAHEARKAVDPLDDPSVRADYRRGIVRAMVAPRAGERHRMNEQSGATKWIGMPVERLEDPPLVTGRGRFAGDINFARQLHMRIVRSNHAHANIVSIDTEAARALPGVVAVWTAADIADVPPIDFREGPIEKLAPYRQPVLAMRQGPLCRRAGRRRVRRRSLRRRGRRRSRHHGGRGTAAAARRPRRARRVLVRPRHRSDDPDPGLWRRRGGVQIRGAYRRMHAHVSGRHSGVPLEMPRRDRPLRRLARRAGAARRRQGAAPEQGADRADAQPRAGFGAVLRVPCRRRLRHPRRDLSRGHPGLRRGDALRAAGEMDRGPPRAPDRRQPFAQPAPPHPRRLHRRGRNPRHRRCDPSTTTAPMSAPTPPASP